MNATKFTPREYAIYNQVWSLSKREREQLDSCFILRSTAARLRDRFWHTADHPSLFLTYKGINYKLNSSEFGSYNGPILLSLRYSEANCYAVALVKTMSEPLSQHALSTFSELE